MRVCVWCGCVRACVGRQFQGSLIDCLSTPDVRYIQSNTYRHLNSRIPAFRNLHSRNLARSRERGVVPARGA